MRREAALEILSHNRAELAQHLAVPSLALFGSVARDEGGPASDVDVLVEFTRDAHVGLFGIVRLRSHLEAVLGQRAWILLRPMRSIPNSRSRS